MQINEWWFPYFAKRWSLDGGEEEARRLITDNGCVNAYAAAEILRLELDRADGDMRLALARYHSPHKANQERYIGKLAAAYARVFPNR